MRLNTLPQLGGVELWRGASVIDGAPISYVATLRSSNRKTDNMIQTCILRQDMSPVDAVKDGSDESICGGCIHRAQDGKHRSCYVNVGQAPRAIWKSWCAGKYTQVDPDDFGEYYSTHRSVRLGAYGDPAAVPLDVTDAFMKHDWPSHTGYTHQWKWCDRGWARHVMASVDTLDQKEEANSMGYRTFRVGGPDDVPVDDEIICLADTIEHMTCLRCGLCCGYRENAKNIFIKVHGSGASNYTVKLKSN